MKNTETFPSKTAHNSLRAAIIVAVWTVICLFIGTVSFSMLAYPVYSHAEDNVSVDYSKAGTASADLLSWKISSVEAADLQGLVDGYFCENALNGNVQSYIQAIITNQSLSCDWTSYIFALSSALDEAVNSEKGTFPTSLQKSVITILMCRYDQNSEAFTLDELLSDAVINEAFDNTIGQKGIMSYVYGLNLLETCHSYNIEIKCTHTREDIIRTLIAYQLSDGGYALSGEVGDVDVTAMTIRSLAAAYKNSLAYNFSEEDLLNLTASVDRSVAFLASVQLESGDFASYSSATSESTSQVILAISTLSLDYSDFVINDNSLLDGLLIYQLPDGSFSHTTSPLVTNDMASAQAFEALTSICQNQNISTDIRQPLSIKTILYIIVFALSVAAISIFTVTFLRTKKLKQYLMKLLSTVLVAGIAVFAIYSVTITSREDYLSAPGSVIVDAPGEGIICISYSINCSTVESDNSLSDIYSCNTVYVKEGSTAFDVLIEICRLEDIQIDYESNSVYGTAYIKGINSLYEFDHGDLSGWMYRVNGEFPSIGCGYYTLSDGDCVEWLYTTDLGRDLEND